MEEELDEEELLEDEREDELELEELEEVTITASEPKG